MTKTYKDKDQYKEKKLKFPRGPYRSSWDQPHELATRHKRSTNKSIIEQDLEDLTDLDECHCDECRGDSSHDRLMLKIDYLRGKIEQLENVSIYILQRNEDNSWNDITDQKYFPEEVFIELICKFASSDKLNNLKNIRLILNERNEQTANCSYVLSSGFKEAQAAFLFEEEQWMEVFDSLLKWLVCEDGRINKQWKKYKVSNWQENTQDFINKLKNEYEQQVTKKGREL